jgi:RHS repeat-associated protein
VVVRAPFGQATTIALDPNGYASSLTDAADSTVQFTYGTTEGAENGLLSTLTDPKGHIHSFVFTSDGLLTQDNDSAGGEWSLARSLTSSGWNIKFSSRLGRVTTYEDKVFKNGGTARVITEPNGVISTLTQPTSGAVTTTMTGADGSSLASSTQQMGPDPRWGMQAPLVTSATTTTGGLSTSVTHARSVKTNGGLFDLESQTDALIVNPKSSQPTHVTSVYSHGSSSNTLEVTTGLGRTMTVTLDPMNRVTSVAVPAMGTSSFTYNTATCPGAGCGGRVTELTVASSNPKEGTRTVTPKYGYAPDTGFASGEVDSLGRTTSFSRDPVGRVTGALLPPLSGTTPAQNQLAVTYDKNGNVSTIALPSLSSTPPVHGFPSYSPIDLLETYEPPQATPALAARSTSYAYDFDGEPVSAEVPDGTGYATVSATYDGAGRVTEVVDPKGVTDSLGYDKAGLLDSIATSDGTTLTFARSGLLLTGETWSGPVSGSIGWSYDDFFRVASRTIGTTTTSYAFDDDGLYIGTTRPAAFTIARDVGGKNGLLAGSTLGSLTDAWTYDGFGEPSGYSASFGATPVYAMSGVARDAAGRITAMTENVAGTTHTWAFAYDPHGDLVTATRDGTTHSYVFDPNGNRTEVDSVTVGPYDAQDRLVSSDYTYTSNGDLLSKASGLGAGTYAYDLSGNLRSAELASGDKVAYVIDGANRRIGKTLMHGASSITQGFLYDSQLRVAAELDAANNLVSVFVYGTRMNVPDYMVRGGNTYRIVSDWRGSVRAVVDANAGTVIETIDYDAWGNVTAFTDTTCGGGPGCFYFQPFGFAGGIYDKDTGFVRFGARDYDSSVGRWTQKDATGFGGGTNFYAYAFNDPINWIDVNGKNPLLVAVAVVAIVVFVLEMGSAAPSDDSSAPADILGMSAAVIGLKGLPVPCAGAATTTELSAQARAINQVLDPIAQRQRVTAVLATREGVTLVGGGVQDLTAAQVAAAESMNLVPVAMAGEDAEITVIQQAAQRGLTPLRGAIAGGPEVICSGCAVHIEQIGGTRMNRYSSFRWTCETERA